MERFASNRPAGIENFRTIINGYLNELLSYIRGTGGDVRVLHGRYDAEGIARRQGMLGAAPMTDRSGETVLAALATCQCGGIPLEKLSPYAFEGSDGVPLTLHGCIGAEDIAAVEVRGIVFNNKKEWETFVCGSIIEQLAVAQELSGKFCLSAQAARGVRTQTSGDACHGRELAHLGYARKTSTATLGGHACIRMQHAHGATEQVLVSRAVFHEITRECAHVRCHGRFRRHAGGGSGGASQY
eukprot:TRINITY_DN2313_c0_g1_i11.p2 TRINITY_DN2313_c0_g1~~TRINITY_DN2313_c0_g1_i11.p2  ORF type:complete len:242 (+),score=62.89 TRINITY_DN2313_c0_g1_i11:821-1546(+)